MLFTSLPHSHSCPRYGGAERGDRTMLDAIIPAVDTFNSLSKSGSASPEEALGWLEKATQAAEEGAKATRDMKVSAETSPRSE